VVCDPRPEALGAAIQGLAGNRRRAEQLGAAGRQRARGITWDSVIEHLVQDQ
jgi:glycosyltransferase involved in cell wall biosynthesis